MDKDKIICLSAASIIVQSNSAILTTAIDYLDNKPKRKREEDRKLQDHMQYLSYHHNQSPETELQLVFPLERILNDPTRNYMKSQIGLFIEEFNALHELSRDSIERSRNSNRKSSCKADSAHRLYFCLRWLHSGLTFLEGEFESGYSKSSLNLDLPHILKCINSALSDQIIWPTFQERAITCRNEGIFKDCVGICDVVEDRIGKSLNPEYENATFSGKTGFNTKKSFVVCDWRNLIIYLCSDINGGISDRDIFTRTELYLNCGQYFDGGQHIIGDGIFVGDGHIKVSFDAREINNDPVRARFNLAFKELRMQIENVFGREHNWFRVSGNRKKY